MRLDSVDLRPQSAGARAPGQVDVLEELVVLDTALEDLGADEPVLAPVLLARPLVAGRCGHCQFQLGHSLKQQLLECSLAGAGGAGDHYDQRVTC